MNSIRTTITSITVVIILTSILSVFTASYIIIKKETDQNSVEMMNLIDKDTRKSLGKYFESIEQSVEIAANVAIEDLDSVLLVECGVINTDSEKSPKTPAQVGALNTYLRKYCDRIQMIFSGIADNTHGVISYFYCISPEISQSERGFFYLKKGKAGFIEQKALNILQLKPLETLKNKTWYDTAVGKGYPVWIGPYIAETLPDTWIYTYFVPIYKAGMLIGVMGMDIPCETLIEQVKDIHVYKTGYVCLLDPEGKVIYHPDLPMGSDLSELGLSFDIDIFQNESSGDELIRYYAGKEEKQMFYSTLSNGMKLVSIVPIRELNAPWTRLLRTIALIALAAIIVFVALVLFVIRAITYPLRQITSASQKLADGDYDVDLTYNGKDEIGTLTSAFNKMRERIKNYIDDLNHQINHDRMTALPKMKYYFKLAEEERNRLLLEGKNPVIIYFNIIGLSYYNRQYGLEKGDMLIKDFAGILSRQFGEHRICRFNGDRFSAVSEEEIVEKELAGVLQECENAMNGNKLPLRIGIYPDRLEKVDINIACDRAKFACDKKKGEISSSITYYDDDMLKRGDIYRHILNNLDRALNEGWVKVFYQPIVRASNGKICDEEALARWDDPVMGFLSPEYFISALEESKLIYKLDLYVVDRVLEKMKKVKESGEYLTPQSINLSRMDFESCDIVEEIRRRVDAAGFPRSMISVEITESVVGSNFEFMKGEIARFQELGFPVWMDDFGSGYSSLDVLHEIHFDLIKFDMLFMNHFDRGDESRIILNELMNMAIGLGMETICEGVEETEQVEFLREIGCTRIQGYHYGKPTSYEEIVALSKKGEYPEFENPEETAYYASIGRINLYDLATLVNENDDSMNQYFNTLPMSIIEVNGTKFQFNRCNHSFRDFLQRTLGVDYFTEEIDCTDPVHQSRELFLNAVLQCGKDGNRTIIDTKLDNGTLIHTVIRRIAVNPVTGSAAIAVAVLAVTKQ